MKTLVMLAVSFTANADAFGFLFDDRTPFSNMMDAARPSNAATHTASMILLFFIDDVLGREDTIFGRIIAVGFVILH